jgi:hypothetical protein
MTVPPVPACHTLKGIPPQHLGCCNTAAAPDTCCLVRVHTLHAELKNCCAATSQPAMHLLILAPEAAIAAFILATTVTTTNTWASACTAAGWRHNSAGIHR